YWEDHFVEQEEAPALLRTDELIDVGARDRHFAARTYPLKEAEGHHREPAPGEQARDVHRDKQYDGDKEDLEPAEFFVQRSENHGTKQLADITGGDDHADLRRRELPFGHELRHRKSDRKHGVGIEERRDADDHAQEHQPAGDGKALDPRNELGARRRIHWSSF